MALTLDIIIHISAGSVGLITGATALSVLKGGKTHKNAGFWYVVSMMIMTIGGAALAAAANVLISVLAGSLSAYLVLSGWLPFRLKTRESRRAYLSILLFGASVASLGLYTSYKAASGVTDIIEGYPIPAAIYYIFTFFALLGVIGDIVLLANNKVSRKYQISRHVWRMCIPMYIAASSFFSGQQDVFPEVLRGTVLLSLPPILVVLVMIYSLIKIWYEKQISNFLSKFKSLIFRIENRRN